MKTRPVSKSFLVLLLAGGIGASLGRADEAKSAGALPRVLLIGDSISMGYTPIVTEMLRDEAEVVRNRGNAKNTVYGLEQIDGWLAVGRWDVIHFNWGLHDVCYRNPESTNPANRDKVNGTITTPLDQYETNLETLVLRLKETGAALIWASTTLVPEGDDGRFVGDEVKYNAAAAKIMKKHGVVINDLHAVSAGLPPEAFRGPGNVHYTDEGSIRLAERVVEAIRSALKKS
jgi:hypothetical protein